MIVTNITHILIIMTSLSCVTLNTRGCRDSMKRYQIFEHLKQFNRADFYLLQETHTTTNEQSLWSLVWRGKCVLSHETSNSGGVAILFHPNTKIDILQTSEPIPGRILHVNARINDTTINIINVYAHTNAKERSHCFAKLHTLLSSLNEDPIILGGDFNCTLNPELDRQDCVESERQSVRSLSNIINKYKLIDSWRDYHGNDRNYT